MTPWRLEDLELIDPDHIYIHRPTAREVRATTKLLRAYGLGFQGVASVEALHRGAFVHECAHLWSANDLDESSIPEKWRGYVAAFIRAVAESGTKITTAEWRFYHPTAWWAGTLDAVGIRGTRRVLLEYKTGDATDVDAQCASYWKGWEYWNPEKPIDCAECWKLNEDGTYRVIPIDLAAGWRLFVSLLEIDNRLTERRRNKRAA